MKPHLRENHDRIIYMSLKTKIVAGIITLGLILIAIFKFGLDGTPISVIDNNKEQSQPNPNEPALISSEPPELFLKKPLVFRPDQVIKLNFNTQLQNAPETKLTIEPAADVEVKISDDFKSVTITPKKPYKLGQGYTLFLKADTKLQEQGKVLGKDYDMHFNVINYSGI